MTAGEQLVGRVLAKEVRGGVEHYIPGQHEAVIHAGREYGTDDPCEIGQISYVDRMGHACVLLVFRKKGGEWMPTWASRAGQFFKEDAHKVRDDFQLSDAMLAALAVAPYEDVLT